MYIATDFIDGAFKKYDGRIASFSNIHMILSISIEMAW